MGCLIAYLFRPQSCLKKKQTQNNFYYITDYSREEFVFLSAAASL